jgi:hypothetical protein
MLSDHELDKMTSNWKVLNANLKAFTEDELKRAIARKLTTASSKDSAIRLHQRYCAVRDAREREEILAVYEPIPDFIGGAV